MSWTVSDVMSKDPVTVEPGTSFKVCLDLMRIHELSAVPVLTGDRLVGIVSESDLLAKEAQPAVRRSGGRAVRKAGAMTAVGLMSGDLVTTTPDAPLTKAASLMFEHRLKVLPVVDSGNRLVGIVSRAQVLKVFLRSDESIRRELAAALWTTPSVVRNFEFEVREGVVHVYGMDPGKLLESFGGLAMGIPGVVGFVSHPRQATEPEVAELTGAGETNR